MTQQTKQVTTVTDYHRLKGWAHGPALLPTAVFSHWGGRAAGRAAVQQSKKVAAAKASHHEGCRMQ